MILVLDPSFATTRVRPNLKATKERFPRLRWFEMQQLCTGSHRPRIPHRGAEDCQEGAQGVAEQEVNGLRGC